MTLRVLIADDEAAARRRVRRLLAHEPDVDVVGECADGAAAIDAIERERPHLAVLDVQMPERDGFAVVGAITADVLPAILFITAYDAYAIRAFDVHAIDYLLKPFTADRFRVALARARVRIAARAPDAALLALKRTMPAAPRYASRLPVRVGPRTFVVSVAEVDWVAAEDNYVRLHVNGREYLLRETLSMVEAQLDPDRFVRIHRSILVAVDRIAGWQSQSHGDAEVMLRDGTRLPVSRTWRDRLLRVLPR
jgi:two-component system LytT family response regulator